jgi:hypothetical protein
MWGLWVATVRFPPGTRCASLICSCCHFVLTPSNTKSREPEFEVAVQGGLVQTESGTVCAELLTGARDDRLDLRQGHGELGEDVGRE